jgi:nucleoside-diphosphate-sugar epimerase
MMWLGKTSVPLTFVHTSDLASYLALAVDADAEHTERVDIGWDRPVSVLEVANLMSASAGKPIKVRAVPSAVTRSIGAVAGRFKPIVQDMTAMFGWFDTGRYVANPRRQEQLFGPPPTAEEAIARLINELVKPNHH